MNPTNAQLASLTDRQAEVYHLIRAGMTTQEVANRLRIAYGTARVHRRAMKRKFRQAAHS